MNISLVGSLVTCQVTFTELFIPKLSDLFI